MILSLVATRFWRRLYKHNEVPFQARERAIAYERTSHSSNIKTTFHPYMFVADSPQMIQLD